MADRMPPLAPDAYTPEQEQAAEAFLQARGTPVFGPFTPLMRSPEAMSLARAMGDYMRYRTSLGERLSEFAILLVARDWSQDLEWAIHKPIAVKAGVAPETAQAIAEGRRPTTMSADEETIHDFVSELLRTRRVSDATYEKARARFGERGVIDLTGIVGYYTLLAMVMNVAQTPPPAGGETLPRFP